MFMTDLCFPDPQQDQGDLSGQLGGEQCHEQTNQVMAVPQPGRQPGTSPPLTFTSFTRRKNYLDGDLDCAIWIAIWIAIQKMYPFTRDVHCS